MDIDYKSPLHWLALTEANAKNYNIDIAGAEHTMQLLINPVAAFEVCHLRLHLVLTIFG